jgi:hypothetical protein
LPLFLWREFTMASGFALFGVTLSVLCGVGLSVLCGARHKAVADCAAIEEAMPPPS